MLKQFADYLTYAIMKPQPASHVGYALNFLVCDTIKRFLLLTTIVFIVAIIRSYFSPEKTRIILTHKK